MCGTAVRLTFVLHPDQELGGNPLHAGLRDGKQINADSDDDTASGPSKKKLASGSASKKNVVAERKKFAAFLGDQSSDSD